MVKREDVTFIEGTPVALRAYSIDEYAPHYHDDCLEMLFVLKGQAHVLASYDRFDLREGDFILTNEGDIHYIRGSAGNVILTLYFDLKALACKYEYVDYLYFICESFNVNNMQNQYVQEVRRLVAAITLEAVSEDRSIQKLNENVDLLMNILIYRFDLVHYHNGMDIPDNQLQRYHRLIKEVEERYGEKLALEDLAQKEFIGKNYISQFWKKMTNMNFTEYLNSRRCEKAEKLLLTTDKNINEISLNCGYSDPKYIYKSFKKWYEKTPSVHKKEYEQYAAKGTSAREYSPGEVKNLFGSELVYVGMDREKADFIRSAVTQKNWKKKYEEQIHKYTGSKIKTEMMRESHQASGLREIHLPLFEDDVVMRSKTGFYMDEKFVCRVLCKAREMGFILHIEMDYERHTETEWEQIVSLFIETIKRKYGADLLKFCIFVIYFDEFERDVEVKALLDRIAHIAGEKNVKMALRFD